MTVTLQIPRRRFGRTEIQMPVFSLGGMRHMHKWKDLQRTPKSSQENVRATLRRAWNMGINHFETARFYGTSELEMGRFLHEFPREEMILQTKVPPRDDAKEFEAMLEKSFRLLKIDHVDLLGVHGVNLSEHVRMCTKRGGVLSVLERWRKRGKIKHIGFSTHGPVEVILEAINTGAFDYVNLHFYYINQRNREAVKRANELDMGVFIISPQEKGGMLWKPTKKLREATKPLSPMLFNQLWTLSHPEVHTLSFGASKPRELASCEHLIKAWPPKKTDLERIAKNIERTLKRNLDGTWCSFCHDCLPCPEEINIPEALRLRNLLLGLDMKAFTKMRYNLFERGGHWFPGKQATACTECGDCLPRCPEKLNIPDLLFETHRKIAGKAVKRLGSQ